MLMINGSPFGNEYFENGEAIYKDVKLHPYVNDICIKFEDNRDIANLIMAVEYIRDEKPESEITLDMYYIPYSGMDRKINDQVFSLKLFANIINKLEINDIFVYDVHNVDVTNQLFRNIQHISIEEVLDDVIEEFKPDILYLPDKGAFKKYPEIISGYNIPIIHGNKVRDLNDKGKIVSYETITDEVDITDKRILIVDDICRKGGTFAWAASELKKLGVGDVALYVSHCEAGIFEGAVLNEDSPISVVYTTDNQPAFLKLMKKEENADKSKKLKVYSYPY